ncbi:element excision factor XisH family protein [Argonema antarcticum]|uniref:element excision factor XisH family protein n=1 Tax=Argonema antarcticum TaxID=2942763 RepID=UPI0020122E22|nr:fatty-acid synthase [Argonema antarcticum A004/B2]
MPARDKYHDNFKNALAKDGWRITHDPLRLKWGNKDLYVDLGAEQLLTAEKAGCQIAVEIKSFGGASEMNDIENAVGQYFVYRSVMARTEPSRTLYVAVHDQVFIEIFEEPVGRLIIEDYQIPLIVFDPQTELILRWIPNKPIVD